MNDKNTVIIFGSGATTGSGYELQPDKLEKLRKLGVTITGNKIPTDQGFWKCVTVDDSEEFKALPMYCQELNKHLRKRTGQSSMETTWSVLNAAHQLRQGFKKYEALLTQSIQQKTGWDPYEFHAFFHQLEAQYILQYKNERSRINQHRTEDHPHYLCGDASTEYLFLIKEIYSDLEPPSNKNNSFFLLFKQAEVIKKLKTIVTFNYDLLVEKNLKEHKVPFRDLLATNQEPYGEHLNLLKLHGSLNWQQFGSTGLDTFDDVVDQYYSNESYAQPAIVPPTFSKAELNDPDKYDPIRIELKRIWQSAEEYLKNARVWIFIGYSFPDTDQCALELFNHSYDGQKIMYVTYDENNDTKKVREELNTKKFEGKLKKYIEDGDLEIGAVGFENSVGKIAAFLK